MKSIKHLYSFSWEDIVFAVVMLAAIVVNLTMLGQLQQLPSPLYGGDYYNHLGSIEHLYQGGSVFESGQMLGEIQWVPWLYHVLVVVFAWVFGLSPLMGIIYFSLVAMLLGCAIIYMFVSRFFDSKIFGLLAVIWHVIYFPLFKYSPFAFYVILPLFLWAAYHFMKKPSYTSAILLGVAYGLAGLSTTYVFIEGTFILGFLLLYFVFIKNIDYKHGKLNIDKKGLGHAFILAAIAFGLGFLIALLWWFNPIFVHHAKTVNDMQIYGFPQVTGIGGMLGLVRDGLVNEFGSLGLTGFSYNTAFWLRRFMMILGIIGLFLLRTKKVEHKFLIILVAASFFGLCVHFITVPLLGTLMASTGLFNVGIMYVSLLLSLLALKIILEYAELAHKYLPNAIMILVAILIIIGFNQQMDDNQENQWWTVGKNPMQDHLVQTRQWVLQNTQLNDVFLTTNEDGFALNAISGRKVVTYRRTHASPYADMNQRMLDAAIMLYTSREDIRKPLLEKYSVDYLYWEPNWLTNEFRISQAGQIEGFFDPLAIDYTLERENMLKEANVSYIRTNWYLDPAWLPTYPKRDVLIITPARPDFSRPWSESLDKHLTLQKEITMGGQVVTRIYKVNP